MTSRGRSVRSATMRSNAVPSTSRRPAAAQSQARPELHVVSETAGQRATMRDGLARLVVWTRSRSTSLIHIVIAAVFLAATLVGALVLRTQMVENSFAAAETQANINTLTQDVEEDQAKLDALESSLPAKAEDMGMVLQQGSLSIDLNGYQPSDTKAKASSDSAKKTGQNKTSADDANKGGAQ